MATKASALSVLLASVLAAPPALAGDRADRALEPVSALASAPDIAETDRPVPSIVADRGIVPSAPEPARLSPPVAERPVRRPAVLPGLYAGFAGLQLFDGYSTTRALAHGAREGNPVIGAVGGNPALFWSVKAAAAIGPILVAERLWKKNKAGAIAVMVAGNGVMAAVAAHNARVLSRQR